MGLPQPNYRSLGYELTSLWLVAGILSELRLLAAAERFERPVQMLGLLAMRLLLSSSLCMTSLTSLSPSVALATWLGAFLCAAGLFAGMHRLTCKYWALRY